MTIQSFSLRSALLLLVVAIVGCTSAPTTPEKEESILVVFDRASSEVRKAAADALRAIGASITKQGHDYIEAYRPFNMGWSKSEGGETVGVWLKSLGPNQTEVRIATAKSSLGRAMQKYWEQDVLAAMRKSLFLPSSEPATLAQEQGKVYFLNVSEFEPLGLAQAVVQEVTGGVLQISEVGNIIANVPKGSFTSVHISAGKHELWVEPPMPGRSVLINVEAGGSSYILLRYSSAKAWAWPFAGDPIEIREISEGEAQERMTKLNPRLGTREPSTQTRALRSRRQTAAFHVPDREKCLTSV